MKVETAGEKMYHTKEHPVLVIGHKNPDTDSICSAIAYANLKNQINPEKKYLPCRAGEISGETQYVLNAFHTDAPHLVLDVRTQVSDMDIQAAEGVVREMSLRHAWARMRTDMLNTLAVTSRGKLEGLLTITDITKSNMDVFDNHILAKANTSFQNILDTLDANLITGDKKQYVTEGKLVIGAAGPETMMQFIENGDIVLVGNREDTQLRAIEKGAGCLVVCMDAPVPEAIIAYAKSKKCAIMATPYDTYTTARLISQSIPISYIMRSENLVTFQMDAPTEEIRAIMAKLRHRDFPVVDEKGEYGGMVSRRSLLRIRRKQLILVDHNEKGQAVDGLEDSDILEIIDHHRIGNIETLSPVYFRNQPLGCTATIVYQMYQENGLQPEPPIAGLLCSAILSDTLVFRSPTCSPADQAAAEALAAIAGIEIEPYAIEMFAAGSNLKNKTEEEIFRQDYKTFSSAGITFGVGQVSSMDAKELSVLKERLLPYIKKNIASYKVDMIFFLLTDILKESSTLLLCGNSAFTATSMAFPSEDEASSGDSVYLPGVVSRKKQFIPHMLNAIQQL